MLRVCFFRPSEEFSNVKALLHSIYDLDVECFDLGFESLSEVNPDQYDVLIFCINEIHIKDVETYISGIQLFYDGVLMVIDNRFNFVNNIALRQVGCDLYYYLPLNFFEFTNYFLWFVQEVKGNNLMKYKDLLLNLNERTCTRGGSVLKLQNMEFRLLRYLLKNKGKVLPKDQILEDVWDMNSMITSKTVEVHICRLRKKLDFEFENKLLHTIHNTGYMLR